MNDQLKTCGTVILVSLLLMAMFVPMGAEGEASKPDWKEGDSWAMGYEKEIQDLFSPAFEQLENQTQTSQVEELNYEVNGKIGFYQVYEVTEASENGYTLDIEAGGGIDVSGNFEAKGEMPKEGSYNISEKPPTETKTISAEGELRYSHDVQGTAKFNSDYALKSLNLTMEVEASGSFSAENIPSFNYDYENRTQTVEYKDYSGSISGDVSVDITVEYDPALDMFDFPIKKGEEWTAHSNMTATGTYEGEIDASGLPESMQKNLEEQGYSLPITLEDLETNSEQIKNGEIDISNKAVSIPMQCTGTEEIVLEDGSTTTAYVIEGANTYSPTLQQSTSTGQSSSFKMKYSPEKGFIVSQSMGMGSTAGNMVSDSKVQMEPMSVEKAKESMNSMQQGDQDSKGFMGTLFSPPMLYVLIGVIAAMVVISMLLIKRGGGSKSYQQYEQQQQGWSREEGTAEEKQTTDQQQGWSEEQRSDQGTQRQQGWSREEQPPSGSSEQDDQGTDDLY